VPEKKRNLKSAPTKREKEKSGLNIEVAASNSEERLPKRSNGGSNVKLIEEPKTPNGTKKNKPSTTAAPEVPRKKPTKGKPQPAKNKPKKKGFFGFLLQTLGIGEPVVLHSVHALEVARALDFEQWHLQRLRLAFDRIDLDGTCLFHPDNWNISNRCCC
jgi:hypothetical protein